MNQFLRAILAVGLLVGGASTLGLMTPRPVTSQDKPTPAQNEKKAADEKKTGDRDQSEFMRKKLGASDLILEGLVTEDGDLVVQGARQLVEMSEAEKWQVRNNVLYKQYSKEFQQSAKKLLEAGKSENFDAVALKWFDTTMKCVECHKAVRTMAIAHE